MTERHPAALGHLAICVPYRDRAEHLREFVPALTDYLGDIPHSITIIEQADNRPFNRGKLLNAGFLLLPEHATHFVVHDVDMLPVSVPYAMDADIHHLANAVEQFDGGVPYPNYFGGVIVFPRHAFATIDGFDNEFWGWGGEDDDLLDRVKARDLPVIRNRGVFRSLPHPPSVNDDHERNIARYEGNRGIAVRPGGVSTCEFTLRDTTELQPGVTQHRVEL